MLSAILQEFIEKEVKEGRSELEVRKQLLSVVNDGLFHYVSRHCSPDEQKVLRAWHMSLNYAYYQGGGDHTNYWHNHGYREDVASQILQAKILELTSRGKGTGGPDAHTLSSESLRAVEHKSSTLNARIISFKTTAGMVDKVDERVQLDDQGLPVLKNGAPIYRGTLGRELYTFNILGTQSASPLLSTLLAEAKNLSKPLPAKTVKPITNMIAQKGSEMIMDSFQNKHSATGHGRPAPKRDSVSLSLGHVHSSKGIVTHLNSQQLIADEIILSPEIIDWASASPLPSVQLALKQYLKNPPAKCRKPSRR